MVHLLRPLGEGGMGRVWVARHRGLETDVVVKFLSEAGPDREDAEARFAREASAAAAVKSPHVVQVFDHGTTADGTRYIVMELLEGRDLASHLATYGPMSPRDVAAVVVQVSKALSKAHQAGVIHRDIKPENIFLCDGAEPGEMFIKVLDFGIAKREQATTSKTSTGQVVGTPYYMSPEQILGEAPVDARTDIWSLGVVAFEILTGKRPFDGATVGAVTLAIHAVQPIPSAVNPTVSPSLDEWFRKACARYPNQRFQTAREAAQAIVAAVDDSVPNSQPLFRRPMLSVSDASDPSLLTATGPHAAASIGTLTTSTSSFTTPVSRKGPPALLLGGAAVAIAVLGTLVVLSVTGSKHDETRTARAAVSAPAVSSADSPPASASASGAPQAGATTPAPTAPGSESAPPPSTSAPPTSALTTAGTAARPHPNGAHSAPSGRGTAHPVRRPNDDDIK